MTGAKALLICSLLLLTVFAAGRAYNRSNDSVRVDRFNAFRLVHEQPVFDVAMSTRFFNRNCLTSMETLSFTLGANQWYPRLVETSETRSLQQKVTDTFLMVTGYPGGKLVYHTVCAGVDLMNYSCELTSIQYENLLIGSRFGGAGRGFLKTGLFYDF
jgi:hypothetical protein